MKIVKYAKLIRDNIPTIIEKDGKICLTEVLGEELFLQKLVEKLGEELQELVVEVNSKNNDNAIKELADIQEVVFALVKELGMTKEEFEQIRLEKVDKNGAFEKKLLLKEVRE